MNKIEIANPIDKIGYFDDKSEERRVITLKGDYRNKMYIVLQCENLDAPCKYAIEYNPLLNTTEICIVLKG